MNKKKNVIFWFMCIVSVVAMFPNMVFATARVLEFDFTVDESWSYSFDSNDLVEADSSSHTNELSGTITETVDVDNQDGSFDIDVNMTDMLWSEDGAEDQSLSDQDDLITVIEASGRITSQANWKTLFNFSSISSETWDSGTVSDDDGLFVSTAVDVNDTWYVDHTTTPYGQSPQTVTATATLQEWTTLNGHNVAKIRYTWTEPTRQKRTSGTVAYLEGDLECERIVYFDYENNKVVKDEQTSTGTLTYIEGVTQDNIDFTSRWTLLLN